MELDDGTVRADNGPAEFAGEGALMDACAVFEEREEVGGPEENIDRVGVVKNAVDCPKAVGMLTSMSDGESG